jgi:tetratricopeptide (TPR) repeat protein
VRGYRWDDLLARPAPDGKLPIAKAMWHYGRSLALLARGKTKAAEKEVLAFQKLHEAMPEDLHFGNRNMAKKVLAIPAAVLQAKIALAQQDAKTAILLFNQAIEAEDDLNYIEPADWYNPVRENLGALYLRLGQPAEAEKVFRADLEKNRRNPRSLLGLMHSLKAQDKTYAAQCVQQEFQAAWRNAEGVTLRVEDW